MNEGFEGFEGVWLRSPEAEAFVAIRPFVRLFAFSRLGASSPLKAPWGHEYCGLRTWVMEPEQTEMSGLPALEPGTITARDRGHLTVEAAANSDVRLQISTSYVLKEASITIHHELRNLTDAPRDLGLWAITAVDPAFGTGVLPLPPDRRNKITFFPGTCPDDTAISLGRSSVAVDFGQVPTGPFIKIGADSPRDWCAAIGERSVLNSRVTVAPQARYPEGGSTVTLFSSGQMDRGRFAEIENVGPLRRVAGNGSLSMTQELSIDDPADAVDLDRFGIAGP